MKSGEIHIKIKMLDKFMKIKTSDKFRKIKPSEKFRKTRKKIYSSLKLRQHGVPPIIL